MQSISRGDSYVERFRVRTCRAKSVIERTGNSMLFSREELQLILPLDRDPELLKFLRFEIELYIRRDDNFS